MAVVRKRLNRVLPRSGYHDGAVNRLLRMPFVPKASFLWRVYRRLVRTRVAFFAVPEALPDADVLKLCNLPEPYPGVANESCPTIVIDLTACEEDLWNAVDPKSRKVIRQAGRDGVTVEPVALTEENWNAFLAAYRRLLGRKQKAGALGVGQISELVAQDRFVVTVSRDANGAILSWHGYVLADGRARMLNTVSAIDPARDSQWNNLVGRANRLHHWQDMLRFKQDGITSFDLGGVYRGADDQEQLNITRFKRSFGGRFADTFDAVLPLTLKGRLALLLVARMGAEARAGGSATGAAA